MPANQSSSNPSQQSPLSTILDWEDSPYTSLKGTTFHVVTFGCQMNKHDSERIVGMLSALGSSQVQTVEESDIVIFVTCCVREAADIRLMGQVASLKNIPLRDNAPVSKRVVVIGCSRFGRWCRYVLGRFYHYGIYLVRIGFFRKVGATYVFGWC